MNTDNPVEYFIAAKREFRDQIPEDWHERISAIEGVEIVNPSRFRAKIIATPDMIKLVEEQFGALFYIEKPIGRRIL